MTVSKSRCGARTTWPIAYAEVAQVSADSAVERSQIVDPDHGRIETRTHAICHHVDRLSSDRRHPGKFRFLGLAAIGMVGSETERDGAVGREWRFHLCSAQRDVETFTPMVRGHWRIENRVHWALDAVFRDDLARLHSGNGPANMAVIRHSARTMLSQASQTPASETAGKKPARITIIWPGSSTAPREMLKGLP